MSLTRKQTAELNTRGTIKAAQRARTAGSAAAANAASAAQNAAAAAQNAAGVAQTAAQNAAVIATNAAQVAANAAQNAAAAAASAAQNASEAAQTAATGLSKGAKVQVRAARSWTAPRLENAADYTSNTVAPKVSAALRAAARQVSPPAPKRSKKTVLAWSLLGTAVAAGLGAAAAVVRYRYRAAIAADSETADEEVLADSSGSQAAPASPDAPPAAGGKPTDPGTEKSANGRVTASGR